MGDRAIYEQTIRVAAQDSIALNVGNTWYRAEPGETEDRAFDRLRRQCFRTGRELDEVQLGVPGQVGSGGVSVPPAGTGSLFTPPAPTSAQPTSVVTPTHTGATPPAIPITAPVAAPVIRQSNGAKSGINLLGDIERWGLPDHERVAIATLTMRGLTTKDLRELCTKLPPRLLAELQITSTPDQQGGTGK